MKKKSVLLILCALFMIVACRKNISDRTAETQVNKTVNEYVVDYRSSFKDSVLHFELEISKTAEIIKEDLDIDLKGKRYLKTIYQTLQERSLDSKYSNITVGQAREICLSLRAVIAEHTSTLTPEQLKSPNIQGMYMSLAFARRILKNKMSVSNLARTGKLSTTDPSAEPPLLLDQPSYAQDVYEGYEIGLAPFVFNEDIIVNKQAFLDIVDEDAGAAEQDDRGLYVFQDVLNSMLANSFSLKDLLTEIDYYVATHPENWTSGSGGCAGGWWPSGSSHGCCGNYSGCCYYWHPICYVHDKICSNCKPRWFCFSGCVPDPRSVSQPAVFTFLEDPAVLAEEPGEDGMYIPATVAFEGIYYKTELSELSLFVPQLYTDIYLNPTDLKYYSDLAYTILVPDGYYDSPNEIVGNNHKYYHIVGGVVVARYGIVIFQ
ncbi:hypothetical protein GFS24_13445 [Chitinophaga sp. SYP-B3965]|uniref:hypothetical protein n=1 Tax=Chitinophaga sp. SYP-B3965 TaxID=2663120 RepID=UPI0012999E9F|nr:hypothetical protein [Chitinophaga sp. SYP-B3965]MRG46128.1 hypothetical protein [Chitinophaga sp. SYP-B3965]